MYFAFYPGFKLKFEQKFIIVNYLQQVFILLIIPMKLMFNISRIQYMRKNYALVFLLFVITSVFIYYGCKSDNSTEPTNNSGNVTTTISGTILDESNQPIAGVEISSAGKTAVTNALGGFIFSNIQVPSTRYVVNASKSGYFKGSYSDAPVSNGTSNIKIYLMTKAVTKTVSASTGGEVALNNGSKVKLDANTVTNSDGSAYTGNVNLSVGYLDPTSENFASLVPGGDMQAQRTDNSETTLYSYGIIKVDMKNDNGDDLKIKSGNTSEITVDIPSSMAATAPETIPLWHYDETTGMWKEEGTATKQGDKYVGTVAHFSDWNCDTPEGTATVHGLVVDCNNQPVPGINVKIGQASANTAADGTFERRVPANTAFEVQVLGTRNFGLTSQPVSVPAQNVGANFDAGTLSVQCPAYVTGLIKCGTDVKFGQVVISWDGGYNAQYTDATGKFNLATDLNKNAELSIYTFDGKYKNLNVTTPFIPGGVNDLGTIEVCDQVVTGDNKFIVTGSGFTNQTFIFAATDTDNVYGYFDPADSLSIIWMYKVFAPDTILMWFSFNGTGTGTPSNITMWFFHNSKTYYGTLSLPNSSATVSVTTYGGVGGLIEGTFSGSLIDILSGGAGVTISNGQFSVVRLVTGSPGEKAFKDKIPIEIREKYNIK